MKIASPTLIQENFHGFNIIKYNEKFYAIKRGGGEICLEKIDDALLTKLIARKLCFVNSNYELLKIEVSEGTKGVFVKLFFIIHKIFHRGPQKLFREYAKIRYRLLTFFLIPLVSKKIKIKPNISVMLPSRGRAKRAQYMIKSFLQMAKNPHKIEFLVLIDTDDIDDYELILKKLSRKFQIKIIRIPPFEGMGRMAKMYNHLAAIAQGEILMYAADDIIIHTTRWDEMICKKFAAFSDRILLCSDKGTEMPIHGFVSKKSFNVLGYIFPSDNDFTDNWLYRIYRAINRHFILPNLCIEHRHWHTYPHLFDETYAKFVNKQDNQEKSMEVLAQEMDEKILQEKKAEVDKEINILKAAIAESK